ncbi:hypothetical protein FOZ63_030206 [Perkinsus olseni]|uniref:Uncharacterized protein n=1 Tax=Perkinsus olseni TaxID=32597 RepID=A0A7J6S0G5_PEROL|nr:hypothetical protein FOZ63_030206 [Perkinsus olseni]
MAWRPKPGGGDGLIEGEELVGEVITPRERLKCDGVVNDNEEIGKQQNRVDYSAFHTEAGYFTGPAFMRTWSEAPVDWSWEILHAIFCACAAFIQISFITGAPWEANIHLVVVITFLMSQRLFYAFWGGNSPHRRSSLIRPEDFGDQDRSATTIARDVARFFLLAMTFLDVGYCTAAVVQQDLVAQGGDKRSAFYGYVLATEYFLPPLLLSSVSVALLRQSPDFHTADLTAEALDARVNATENLFLAPIVQSLRRLVVYAAEAVWCLGVLPCRFARGPLHNDVSISDTRVNVLGFLSVSASSAVPGSPSATLCFMTAIFTLHVLIVVLCTDLNTRPLELQHLTHLLGKWKIITEQSALIKVQAGAQNAVSSGGGGGAPYPAKGHPHQQAGIKVPEWSPRQCPYAEVVLLGSIVRDKGRYYEAQNAVNTMRPSQNGGVFQHISAGLYGNVVFTRQIVFTLHVLLAWVYFIVMAYGALFNRSSSSIGVCTPEESFIPKTVSSISVPHDFINFTLDVGGDGPTDWEARDARRVLNPAACSASRAAWIAPWLLLILGHSVQVHHMSGRWSVTNSPASLQASQDGPLNRACHQNGWIPPLYHQLTTSTPVADRPGSWIDEALPSEKSQSRGSSEFFPVWERSSELPDALLRSIATSSTYRFFRSARSPGATGLGSAIRAVTGVSTSTSDSSASSASSELHSP